MKLPPNWKTTLSGAVTALAGFVVASQELFAGHHWVIAVSKYVMAGGFASLGFFAHDKQNKENA